MSAGVTMENTVRTVYRSAWTQESDLLYYDVAGSGFLYNMVRIMAGTLIDISRGRIPADSIGQIIEARNRFAAGYTAPARGLFLNKIHY